MFCLGHRHLTFLSAFVTSLHPALAHGEGAAEAASPAGDEAATTDETSVTPPRLLHSVGATLPQNFQPNEPVAVVLELTLGSDGSVEHARALGDPPPELATLAVAASRSFAFAPARRGDEPIRVMIEFTYWFQSAAALGAAATEPPRSATPPATNAPSSPPPAAIPSAHSEPEYEAVAEVLAPPREPTRRTLPKERLATLPGSRGDAIRAVEVLPGVSRAPLGSNPILRGSAGHESATFLDGVELPQLYHFGGVTSVVHPALLDSVNLYSSNFSARYGRVTGGIIEAELRGPRTDTLHGAFDVNLIDSSLFVEGPLGDGLSGAAAARRSNIDVVFESFVPDDAFSVVAAPIYWDYQVLTEYQPQENARLQLRLIGSRDSLKFVFAEPQTADPTLRGELSGSLEYHTLTLGYEHSSRALVQSYLVSVGRDTLRQRVGANDAYFDGVRLAARSEWEVPASDELTWITGVDFAGMVLDGAYRGPAAPAQEGSLDQPEATVRSIVVDEARVAQMSPAAYAEARWFPTERWLVVPGFRADFYHDLDALTLNPRLGQRYLLTEDWTLKAGVGGYSQRPLYYETLDVVGNPRLDPYHALHTSAGVERRFGSTLTVDGEAFYKHLYDRVVASEGGAPPNFINDGEGRSYGLETQARFTPNPAWFGQLSYTLSRSERQDRTEPWRLFDFDQTHVLNAALAVALGSGWELGGRLRWISGNPVTEVVGAVYDARTGVYQPRHGAHNAARDPAFHQLDLRLDKRFTVGRGSLGAYLEVLNATNAENAEGYSYNFDYSERTRITSQPFFPNLGIRGEL